MGRAATTTARVILVTNNYHMPRSLLEMGRLLDEAELEPYPVVNSRLDGGGWMVKPDALRVIFTEYKKYLARSPAAWCRRQRRRRRRDLTRRCNAVGSLARRAGAAAAVRCFLFPAPWCNQRRFRIAGQASMLILRSLAFNVVFYVNLIVQMILWTPYYFLSPRHRAWFVPKFWSRTCLWLHEKIAGTKSEITGVENLPEGLLHPGAEAPVLLGRHRLLPLPATTRSTS